jgi:hypothetical protein
MCAQAGGRDTFDRLASEYDELKLRVIPGYRQVQDLALRYASNAEVASWAGRRGTPRPGRPRAASRDAGEQNAKAALTSLLARQIEHLEQRVRDHIELLWLKSRQGALDQPAIVDGSHLVDQGVGIPFQGTGRSNTNPERFGGLGEPRRERDHERRRMLGV